MLYCSWDMVLDACNYFSFWTIFDPFTLLIAPKKSKLKKMKKTPGDIIILHICTKNHDHMVYCFWDMMHDRCNCYFSSLAIFVPFYPCKSPKKQTFEKMEKNGCRYHHFTYVYQKLSSDDVWFLRCEVRQMDSWTDWWMDGKSDFF